MIEIPVEPQGIKSTVYPNDIEVQHSPPLHVDKVAELIDDWRHETNYF